MTFDPELPVETHDGRKAKIIGTIKSRRGESLVARVEDKDGTSDAVTYYADGRYYRNQDDDLDLVNIPETKSFWVNVYQNHALGRLCDSPDDARRLSLDSVMPRTSVIEIRMCEGRFVEAIQHDVEK